MKLRSALLALTLALPAAAQDGPAPIDSGPAPLDSGPAPLDQGPAPLDPGPAPLDAATDPGPAPIAEGGAAPTDIGLGPTSVSEPSQPALPDEVRERAEGEAAASKEFVKGELAQVGSSKLLGRKNRFGMRLGYEAIGETRYFKPTFELDLRLGRFGLGLGLPTWFELCRGPYDLKFPPCDTSHGLTQAGVVDSFRQKAFDERSDYAQVLRYLTYGRKEGNLYLNVSQLYAATIGHGPILRRYFANADVDSQKVGAQFDAYNDYGGFELFTGNIVRPTDLVAALLFIKPGSLFSDGMMAKSFSIGFTYAADLTAPVELEHEADDPSKPVINAAGSLKALTTAKVQAFGMDAEIKVVKTASVDIKPFLDFSQLSGAGNGLTLGALGRFNFGSDPVHALRLIAEVRSFDDNYRPSYFDTFYEIQKWQYITGVGSSALPTKWAWLKSQSGPRQFGYYLEATYAPVGYFALSTALEMSNAAAGNNFLVHFEVPATDWLKFFATYHRRGFEGKFFDWKEDNNLLYAALRMKTLPFLFINARYYRTFQMDTDARAFRNVSGYDIDVELGFEFGESFASQ